MSSAPSTPPKKGKSGPKAAVDETLVLLSPVEQFSAGLDQFLTSSLPDAKVHVVQKIEDFTPHLSDPESFVILLAELKAPTDLARFITLIRAQHARMRQFRLGLVLISKVPPRELMQLNEKLKTLQLLSTSVSPKALRLKLDYLFGSMVANSRPLEPEADSIFRSANPNALQADGVARFKKDAARESPELEATQEHVAPRSVPDLLVKPEEVIATPWNDNIGADPKSAEMRDGRKPEETSSTSGSSREKSGKDEPPLTRNRPHIVLISNRSEDRDFCLELARRAEFNFHLMVGAGDDLSDFLINCPESVVFWDVDHARSRDSTSSNSVEALGLLLSKLVPSERIFAISDRSVKKNPHLFNFQRYVFGHHLFRRYDEAAIQIYTSMVTAMLTSDPFGLQKYVVGRNRRQRIELTESSHRKAAVDAIHNFLKKNGMIARLARQVADAADEVLLNAIYHAPRDSKGRAHRKDTPPDQSFTFTPEEVVTLDTISNDCYFGISIRDNHGSLEKEVLLSLMQESYGADAQSKEVYSVGLNKVLEQGISLYFLVEPGKRTEVIMLMPKVSTYREFKNSFRFLSIYIVQGRIAPGLERLAG